MGKDLMLNPLALTANIAAKAVLECNAITLRFGLALSPAEARELVETQSLALLSSGRIDFAGGVLKKMVLKFCDSPFLSQFNYAATLHDLVETFYYFKNETMDELDDDELLDVMKEFFDRNCRGSVELLQGRELENLARRVRYGPTGWTEAEGTGEGEEDDE